MKYKIIVTGANGQLGTTLRNQTDLNEKFECHFFSRKELDITNKTALKDAFQKIKPHFFINAAAYTAVDKAEEEIVKCFMINDYALLHISDFCAQYNTKLIHISSDYVYHLETDKPLIENDATLPRGIYAQTKLAGEQRIIRSKCDYIILRTSWVYGVSGHNFIKTVLRLAKERDNMNVVNDQIGSLTNTVDLSDVIMNLLIKSDRNIWNQIYNYSNEGVTNWYEIADYIVKKENLSLDVNPIPTTEYPTPAERPKWSVMSKDKIKSAIDIKIPHWKSSLDKCLNELMYS